MPFQVIAPTEVDAKSPIDDSLMGKIKNDLDFLNAQLTGGKSFIEWALEGSLRRLQVYRRPISGTPSYDSFTPTVCRVSMKKSGLTGTLALDIRKVTKPNTPIIGIDFQYTAATQSIANIAPAHATQSITRTTSQISTQSISLAKTNLNIQSIVQVAGTNKWRMNVDTLPDADWVAAVGKYVTVASATSGGNNGTFAIAEVNQSGHPSIVVTNASGVAQTGAAGTVQLQLFSFNQTNPVSSEFVAGESCLTASHTTGANNGTFEIYAVNRSGNNLWFFIQTGAVQAGVAGTIDVQRFQYNFSGAASATDFILGEKAKMASHTSGVNNGNFKITGVNVGGNNLQVYNSAGTTQGGVAGTANTNRWTYSLPTDPAADISVGTKLQLETHTTPANNGEFLAVEVKRSGLNNVVIYNEAGVAQGGAVGNTRTTRKLIKFTADQASVYSVNDYFDMVGTISGFYAPAVGREPFQIVEVNRGGGANYNVVVEAYGAPSQASPAGFIVAKYRTIFNTKPSLAASVTGLTPNRNVYAEFEDFVAGALSDGEQLALFCTSMQLGDARDLTVNLQ